MHDTNNNKIPTINTKINTKNKYYQKPYHTKIKFYLESETSQPASHNETKDTHNSKITQKMKLDFFHKKKNTKCITHTIQPVFKKNARSNSEILTEFT